MPVKYYKVYNKSQTLYVTVLENGTRTIMDGKGHKVLLFENHVKRLKQGIEDLGTARYKSSNPSEVVVEEITREEMPGN